MKGQSYVILAIIFVIIVALFAVMNVEAVEVNYLFWSGESPLILVILFSVLMGGIITATVGAIKFYQFQKQLKQLNTENREMKKILEENNLLENIEIDDQDDNRNK
ncbi:LapA family protein [Oceanobacillus salinisoli]|uniref:LapA family protein n=1 Tax=Oceanobacillus salinisoli TaxID=2678611 RepID=UPI0012E1FF85|nr:lipopolysaccharide assembly protein LapA domain-containing protein [Oceanobacillus salinisoli]